MYKIEITADTLAELAGKAAALASSLNSIDRLLGTIVSNAPKATPIDPIMPEVAEAAAVDPTPAPKSAPAAEATESPPTTPEPSSAPAPAASASEALNFETDVAPYVLQVVKEKGKPAAQEILSQFGVEKASNLDPAMWPELVEALKGALS